MSRDRGRMGRHLRHRSASIPLMVILCLIIPMHLMADETVEVVIHGLGGDVLANVTNALAVPEGIVRDGKVNELWLEHFRKSGEERIREALQPFGYYDPDVDVSLEKSDNQYILKARVSPGPPVRITDTKVVVTGPGAREASLTELAEEFQLRKGDILLHQKYEEGKGSLKAFAHELGYLDADFTVSRILVSRENSSARIELFLETGPRYRFGQTRIEGAPEYPEKFIGRYKTFREGQVFSHAKLGETQLNLMGSERFKEVILMPQKDKAEEYRVPILIQLKTAPPRRLSGGLGYGTDTGARISAGYRDLNVFSKGHNFNSRLSISERLRTGGIGYTVPGSQDMETATSFQVNVKHEDVDAYETEIVSCEVSRTKGFRKGRLGIVYAKAQYEESTIAPERVTSFTLMPGIRFSHHSYDDLVRPTKGFRYVLELRGTTAYLGSGINLLQFLPEANILVPLPWRLSVTGRLKSAFSLQDEPLRELPASLRFFAGGDRSVRGYEYQSLGPRDSSGDVTGGKHLLALSIEIEKALFEHWGIAAFYDTGNSFNAFSDITLYQGAGIGVRYYTVVGAIRLDVARQIGVDDPEFRIHFTAGIQL